jgi:hypothetical protein
MRLNEFIDNDVPEVGDILEVEIGDELVETVIVEIVDGTYIVETDSGSGMTLLESVAEGVRDLGYEAQALIMKLRRDVEERRLQPTPQAVLAAARELAGDMDFAPQLLVQQVLGKGVAEGSGFIDQMASAGHKIIANKKTPNGSYTVVQNKNDGKYEIHKLIPGNTGANEFEFKSAHKTPQEMETALKALTGVAEGSDQGEYSRVLTALRLYHPRFEMEELNTPEWYRVIANKANVTPEYAGQVINDFVKASQPDEEENLDWMDDTDHVKEAEYQGRTVKLGKPQQGDVKKFKVYVKNPKTGKTIKVNFGDPNMRIKKSNPKRRKSFRARHNCANPGPRTKARYWSCRKW